MGASKFVSAFFCDPKNILYALPCRCWMLARRGRKRYSMGLRSPLLPMELQPAFFQLLISHVPTFRLCKCPTTGSAQCDTFLALHGIGSGGGKHQTLCIEGFLWVSEKNQSTWAAALPSHICLKVRYSRQEGSSKACVRFLSSASDVEADTWARCAFLPVATCYVSSSFPYATSPAIVDALSSSWAAALWSLHIQLFTSGTFKDNKNALFMLTKIIQYCANFATYSIPLAKRITNMLTSNSELHRLIIFFSFNNTSFEI